MPAPDEIALFAGRLDAAGAEYMITGATAAIIDRDSVAAWAARLGLTDLWASLDKS